MLNNLTMKNRQYFKRDIISEERKPSKNETTQNHIRLIISIFLSYILTFLSNTFPKNLEIYFLELSNINLYTEQSIIFDFYREVRKPLKYPVFCLRWDLRRL